MPLFSDTIFFYSLHFDNKDDWNESGWSPALIVDIYSNPPYTPNNAIPQNGSTNISINADLSWIGGDPDPDDIATYDMYLGTTSPPLKVASNQSNTSYNPVTMNYGTQYYWRIVAWDNHNVTTAGPLWNFITEENDPPIANDDYVVVNEDSVNNKINVLVNDSDPNGHSLKITSVTQPVHGLSSTNGDYVYYTPGANYNGPDSFTYTISDGYGGSDTATVFVP